jgi:hypothetical protein
VTKAKTRLFLEIDYDPGVTDPEGLASAMDRLLETALSIPGVLDEYGSPKCGEFLVATRIQGAESTPRKRATEPIGERHQAYRLKIDGTLFRSQRQMLLRLAERVRQGLAYTPSPGDAEILEGLVQLTDEIADQAHDRFGLNCLLANR